MAFKRSSLAIDTWESRTALKDAGSSDDATVLTEAGSEVAVVLSVRAFRDLSRAAELGSLQSAVDAAEQSNREEDWVEHSVVEARLKQWAGLGG